MIFELGIVIAGLFVYFWVFTGLLTQSGLGFPLVSSPEEYVRTGNVAARGFRASILFHALAWPLVLTKCKENKYDHNHWCGWVKYPRGRYSLDDLVIASLKAKYPETDWDGFYAWKKGLLK